MNKIILIVLGITFLSGCIEENRKVNIVDSKFNFEAADKYFELIEKLKLNGEIDSSDWSAFLELKGNKLYIEENNISKEFGKELKKMLEQVYTSSDSLNELRSEDLLYKSRLLYKKEEQNHINHFRWLKNNQLVLRDSIISRTKIFLPVNQKMKEPFPSVYYHGLDFDGSANSKGIFISIMAAYDNNKKRLGNYEAHELHHLQSKSLLNNVEIDNNNKGLIWAMESALNEGLADMIDKDVMLSEESDWWLKKYVKEHYEVNGANVVVELNKYISDEINQIYHSENEYRQLYFGSVGHIPGYYMAKAIKESGRLDELIKSNGNPFLFFKIYNISAIESGAKLPVFDEDVLNYINQLEEKYLK